MGHACPRCGETVRRQYSKGSGLIGGVVGGLIASAISSLECAKCGPIQLNEFGKPIRTKIIIESVAIGSFALAIMGTLCFLMARGHA